MSDPWLLSAWVEGDAVVDCEENTGLVCRDSVGSEISRQLIPTDATIALLWLPVESIAKYLPG